jgi:hypothetical protein
MINKVSEREGRTGGDVQVEAKGELKSALWKKDSSGTSVYLREKRSYKNKIK